MNIDISKKGSNKVVRNETTQRFNVELYKSKPMTTAEEEDAFAEYAATKNPEIRDRIISSNMRLVFAYAKRYASSADMMIDLTSEGYYGLCEAFDRFEPSRGLKFMTYATHWVYKAMMGYLQAVHLVKRTADIKYLSKCSRERDLYFAKAGRFPTNEELCDIIEEKYGERPKVSEIEQMDFIHTDASICNDDNGKDIQDTESLNLGMYSENDYLKEIEREDRREKIENMLLVISPKDREIVKKLFGIGYDREYTNEEIGEEYGISPTRVMQIFNKAKKTIASKKYSLAM